MTNESLAKSDKNHKISPKKKSNLWLKVIKIIRFRQKYHQEFVY